MKTHIRLILTCVIATLAFTACKKEPPAGTGSQPLDYALQVIPDIHEVMPKDLIIAMGSDHLFFGDNPPAITTPFYNANDKVRLTDFVHNTDYNPNSPYSKPDSMEYDHRYTFAFSGQHRGVLENFSFVRDFRFENDPVYGGAYYHEYSNVEKEIFVMGNAPYFTAYFKHVIKRETNSPSIASYMDDYEIERTESVILSGKVTPNGIEQVRFGSRVEGYSYTSPNQGVRGLPEIHDMFIYDILETMPFDTDYNNIHSEQ